MQEYLHDVANIELITCVASFHGVNFMCLPTRCQWSYYSKHILTYKYSGNAVLDAKIPESLEIVSMSSVFERQKPRTFILEVPISL